MSKKKSRQPNRNEAFLHAAAKALTGDSHLQPNTGWLQIPGWAVMHQRKSFCHFIAQGTADTVVGASIVSGWKLEWLRRTGIEKLEAVFSYHSIVRMPDGTLMCPSTMKDEQISFLPDPDRFYDHATRILYNLAYFSNKPAKQAVPGFQLEIPAFKIGWRAELGHGYVMSTADKHARWVAYGFGDPYELAASVHADPSSFVDMTFISDLDDVLTFKGITEIPEDEAGRAKLLQDVQAQYAQGDFHEPPEPQQAHD